MMLKKKKRDVVAHTSTIEEAYKELSTPAFAVWIRLMMAKENDLLGRVNIANLIGYSLTQTDVILQELRFLKYVKAESSGPGRPMRLKMAKRALISGPSDFVKLSNTLVDSPSIARARPVPPHRDSVVSRNSKRLSRQSLLPAIENAEDNTQHLNCCVENNGNKPKSNKSGVSLLKDCGFEGALTGDVKVRKKQQTLEESPKASKLLRKKKKGATKKPTRSRKMGKKLLVSKQVSTNTVIKKKATTPKQRLGEPIGVTENKCGRYMATCGEKNGPSILNNSLNISKLREIRDKNKKLKSDKIKSNKRSFAQKTNPPLDWAKLDQRGKPMVTFSPSRAKRKKLIEILNLPDTNKLKKQVLDKMASEFGRIYSRYRRLLQKEVGNVPNYLLGDKEKKYARAAAEHCIRKGVTPRQVLTYWHNNICNFSDTKMRVPPLVFLSSPANIDTVACSDLDRVEEKPKLKGEPVSHSFSDVRGLDSRIRQTLEKHGIRTSDYSDRFLMSVQSVARAWALGISLFADDDIRPMAECLAETIYKNLKAEKGKEK